MSYQGSEKGGLINIRAQAPTLALRSSPCQMWVQRREYLRRGRQTRPVAREMRNREEIIAEMGSHRGLDLQPILPPWPRRTFVFHSFLYSLPMESLRPTQPSIHPSNPTLAVACVSLSDCWADGTSPCSTARWHRRYGSTNRRTGIDGITCTVARCTRYGRG